MLGRVLPAGEYMPDARAVPEERVVVATTKTMGKCKECYRRCLEDVERRYNLKFLLDTGLSNTAKQQRASFTDKSLL